MKNQDLISKRILTVALSLSMLLCSAALFVFSLNFTGRTTAATMANSSIALAGKAGSIKPEMTGGVIAFAGIVNNFAYYIYSTNEGQSFYWKVALSSFKEAK
jgi:hypothetical protein